MDKSLYAKSLANEANISSEINKDLGRPAVVPSLCVGKKMMDGCGELPD